MATWTITASVPGGGAVEDLVTLVESLPDRPGNRAGNVLSFEILRATEFAAATEPKTYLVVLDVDHPAAHALAALVDEVVGVLPDGADVTGTEFEPLKN